MRALSRTPFSRGEEVGVGLSKETGHLYFDKVAFNLLRFVFLLFKRFFVFFFCKVKYD